MISIRQWKAGDYENATVLWRSCDLTLGVSDSLKEINRLTEKNPSLNLIAEENGRLIGTVLGGYDGRRGIIHHLAVEEKYRNRGIARRLIAILEEKMRELGVVKINFWVEARNRKVIDFYLKLEYVERDLITLSKSLDPREPNS